MKNPSDFVGETLGSSEARTRTVLASTIGKILIIDEAYGLGSTSGGSSNGSANSQDSFRAGVIDTIVGEVSGAPGEDRCILLLGYEDKLREMFQRSNPGLSSRFNYSSPFRCDDYTLPQLMEILHLKMERQDLKATPEALITAQDVLERATLSPEYGNARAVENCLQAAKKRHQERLQAQPIADRDYGGELEPVDFDPDFTIKTSGFEDCEQLFQGKISKSAIRQISRLHKQALMARWTGTQKFRDVVPTNFIFRGPPGKWSRNPVLLLRSLIADLRTQTGTGKTTAARMMGKLYYNLGFLATDEVVELNVRDLIAQYVGQTRQKTRDQLARALGRVLVIDNAFQLLKGPYEMEALQELVNCLQPSDYGRKMIVILVGYSEEMKMLLQTCPPLAGLFPNDVKFKGLKAKECMQLLDLELEKLKVSAPFLKDNACDDYKAIERLIHALAIGPMFANAKDIEALAQSLKTALFDDFFKKNRSKLTSGQFPSLPDMPDLSKNQAAACIRRLINQRKCMKPLTPFTPHLHETDYSDDDCRFARAFAHEQMPMIEIRIAQPLPMLTHVDHAHDVLHDEVDLFEDPTGAEQPSRHRPPPMFGTTILLTTGLMAPPFPAMHASGGLNFPNPLHDTAHAFRQIEELDDSSDDEDQAPAPAQVPAASGLSAISIEEQKLDNTSTAKGLENTLAASRQSEKASESAEEDEFAKGSLKNTQDMDRDQKRRYRNMLKDKYPFGQEVSVRTLHALKSLGLCPQGYVWRRDAGRHICEGGCHYGYDFDVRDYMYRNDL